MTQRTSIKHFMVYFILLAVLALAVGAVVTYDLSGRKGNRLPQEYTYQVNDRYDLDPEDITYRSSHPSWPSLFNESRALSVDNEGKIFLAGDQALKVFDRRGKLLETIEFAAEPTAVQWFDGQLYIALKNRIIIHDLQTNQQENWPAENGDAFFTSIAVDKNNVFVADAGNRIVIRYDRQGAILNHIGERDTERGVPGFVIPSPYFELAIAPDGLLRVVNPGRHEIAAYTYKGDREFAWGSYGPQTEGFCGCCNPVSMALMADGRFVTAEKGLTRIKIYDLEGEFQTVVAGPAELLDRGDSYEVCDFPQNCQKGGYDLAVSGEKILVLDRHKNVVHTFEPEQEL